MQAEASFDIVRTDLEIYIKMMADSYDQLLRNPNFLYEDFLFTGGWTMLYLYKNLIKTVSLMDSSILVKDYLSKAEKIENIYYKRWGMTNAKL